MIITNNEIATTSKNKDISKHFQVAVQSVVLRKLASKGWKLGVSPTGCFDPNSNSALHRPRCRRENTNAPAEPPCFIYTLKYKHMVYLLLNGSLSS